MQSFQIEKKSKTRSRLHFLAAYMIFLYSVIADILCCVVYCAYFLFSDADGVTSLGDRRGRLQLTSGVVHIPLLSLYLVLMHSPACMLCCFGVTVLIERARAYKTMAPQPICSQYKCMGVHD